MHPTHPVMLNRRGFCLCCLASASFAAGGGWLTPGEAFAQARTLVDLVRSQAAQAPITVHGLRGGVSVLEGSGGNIAVFAGPEGKLLVDAGLTASRPRIAEALADLGAAPVSHLVNTHWHFDHADGNEWLNGEGATIVAHGNTRRHLMAAQRVEDWNFDFPPSPAGAIPTEIVSGGETLDLNAVALTLTHYPAAHTDGDITVHFTQADILHAGDIYWTAGYPFIDNSTGGTIDGMIRAADAILAIVGDSTIIVPGHGHPSSNRAALLDYRDMLSAIRENVAAMKQQGRTLEEVAAARPTAAYDERWSRFVVPPALFTKLVYQTL